MNTSDSSASPYQAPQQELLNEDEDVGEIRFFSPSCRIGRLRYIAHGMLLFIVSYAIILIAAVVIGVLAPTGMSDAVAVTFGLIAVVGYIFLFYVSVVLMIQRLHDQDLSGWLWLLTFVPIANLVILVMLLFIPGTKGPNRYGHRPPPNKTWHWITALALPLFVVALIGILAAIAIPAYQDYVERASAYENSMELRIEEFDRLGNYS